MKDPYLYHPTGQGATTKETIGPAESPPPKRCLRP